MMYLNALGALLALIWAWVLDTDDPPSDEPPQDSPADDPESVPKHSDRDLGKYKGEARKDGRTAGEKAAEKKWLDSLGVGSLEEAQQKFTAWKELEDDEKSELDKAAECIDKLTKRAEQAEASARELQGDVKQRDRRDAITAALTEAKYEGKISHAIGAVDPEKVKEENGEFDASEAIKALKEDDFPGFPTEAPEDPERTPTVTSGFTARGQSRNNDNRSSYIPNYSVPGKT